MEQPLTDRIRLLGPVAAVTGASVGLTEALLHGDGPAAAALATLRSALVLGPSALIGLLVAAAVVGAAVRRSGAGRLESSVAWVLGGTAAAAATAAAASGVHGLLAGTGHHAVSAAEHALRDGAAVAPAAALALAAATLAGLDPTDPAAARRRALLAATVRPAGRGRTLGATALAVAVVGTVVMAPVGAGEAAAQTSTPAAPGTPSVRCDASTVTRRYDVTATNVRIPYNRWGDQDPHGMVFALDGDVAAVKHWDRPLAADAADDPAANRRLRPRPLVLRAHVGECVAVTVTNSLDRVQGAGLPQDPRVALQPFGLAYDARTSGPGEVGRNADRSVRIGASTTQYWKMPSVESTHLFRDVAAAAGSEADGGAAAHGLYGAMVVEPAGTQWLDPVSGRPLYTGTSAQSGDLYVQATIVPPTGNAFREAVMLAQDELPNASGFGFNFGAEQGSRRALYGCPDCLGEETSLSSWPFGDPALVQLASGPGPWAPPGRDNIIFQPPVEPAATEAGEAEAPHGPFTVGGRVEGVGTGGAEAAEPAEELKVLGTRPNPVAKGGSQENCGLVEVSCWTSNVVHTYKGEPTKIRFGMAGVYETHVFHLHAHQWLADPHDVGSAGSTPSAPSPSRRAASSIIDSQTFGPWEAFTADLLFGSGNQNGTVGDSIFHCHLYAHFAEGFWALLRTHDVLEDGTGETPDRIRVNALRPLPRRSAPPVPTVDNPGYPRFVPGQTGWRAPQPPLGISKDGKWEPRVVAGRALTPADTATERAVQARAYKGQTPKPGAPLADPCPAGARQVDYHVTAIQLDVTYNSAGWHDTQGRVLVPTADVPAIRAGRKQPEPLFFRINVGDCVNFSMTNELPNWLGNDAFLELVQTNMVGQHIHLVKFDVLGSDGSSNGWNYQQAAFTADQAAFNRRVMAGQAPCDEQRGCRLADPADWDPNKPPPAGRGQTIHERWYADTELHTVFTHDHHFAAVAQQRGHYGALVVEPKGFDVRQPTTGRYLQPLNTVGRGTVCTTRCTGTAFGTAADLVGPGPKDDFREFGLAMADWVSLVRKGGDARTREGTVEANERPELLPEDDPGVRTMNYRSAPLTERVRKDGVRVDPAYAFSSWVWGDPETPLLQAYAGDNVRFRLVQGSQEEQHSFTVHGQRWRKEIDDPTSPIVNSQPMGISEAFNIDIRNIGCGPTRPRCNADFLYGGADTQDLVDGAWGILRIHDGRVPGLLPLPDNVPATNRSAAQPLPRSRTSPPRALQGVCPTGTPVRHYDVVAVRTRAAYDPQGSHDPYALVFTTPQLAPLVRAGGRVEPLVLRAAEGECVEVTLTNEVDPGFLEHLGEADGDPTMYKSPQFTLAGGLRVSLHPQLVSYDVTRADGAAVGFNGDQTVAPGERFTYRWYADDVAYGELGASTLSSVGDVGAHRHHGLLAALVVEPRGASWVDPRTGRPGTTGPAADVRVPGAKDFREHVVMYQDALNLRDSAGVPFPDASARDAADRGEVAVNYARAGFPQRLGTPEIDHIVPDANALAGVFSSHRHGDPWTPLIEAEAGDQLRVRVLQAADRSRHHAFALTGHAWHTAPNNSRSRLTGVQGGMTVMGAMNVQVTAGGGIDAAGDYLWGDFFGKQNLSGGSWGLLRVHPRGASGLQRLDVAVP